MSIWKKDEDEPLDAEDTATMHAIEGIARERRAEKAAETTALPVAADDEWPPATGRHNHDPLVVLSRLRADPALALLHWDVRPVAVPHGPDLLGTHVVLDVEHLRDATTMQAAVDARRILDHFAAQQPVSEVVTDDEPGLRGRPRKVSEKVIDGLTVRVAVTLPKDTPLSIAAPATQGFTPVADKVVASSHPYIGSMFERGPVAPAAETTGDAA